MSVVEERLTPVVAGQTAGNQSGMQARGINGAADAIRVSAASVGDYVALLKPRVMSLVVFTALVGLARAPGDIHPFIALVAILAIAVGAGASGALNMWYDADIDRLMSRTARRPVPSGRVTAEEALTFGLILSVLSVMTLGVLVNWFAGAFLAFTIAFYAVFYTMILKRRTAQNIVIGGAAGAFPPMIGWAAVTGGVALEPFVLFLIIFIWTPPHFWALSLLKNGDYTRAGVPMMSVVAGPASTKRQIVAYGVVLAPLGVAPFLLGMAGFAYGVLAIGLGALFVAMALRLWRARGDANIARASAQLFAFSILYLFVLFAGLLVDPFIGTAFWGVGQ